MNITNNILGVPNTKISEMKCQNTKPNFDYNITPYDVLAMAKRFSIFYPWKASEEEKGTKRASTSQDWRQHHR